MYYLSDPTPEAVRIYWAFGSVLALAVVAMLLRPWYRAFPFERTLWFLIAAVYSFLSFSIASQRRNEAPTIILFGPVFWGVTLLACINGFFRRAEQPDRSLVNPRTLDWLFVVVCSGIVFNQWLPTLGHSQETWSRVDCKHNLTLIAMSFVNFNDTNHQLPSADNADPPHSWRVALLPSLDEKQIFQRYDLAAEWDAAVNRPVATTQVKIYTCPSRVDRVGLAGIVDAQQRYYSQYEMLTGPHTAGSAGSFKDFTDGTSNSFLVVESCGLNRVWTDPSDVNVRTVPCGINLPSPTRNLSPGWMSSHHSGGAFAAFADGAVKFLSEKTDPKVLKALATIDDGADVPAF